MSRQRSLPKIPSCLCLHDDYWFVEATIKSFLSAGPVTAFVSRLAWDGSDGEWERCADAARRAGASVVVGDWPDETTHRRHALDQMKALGHRYLFIPDGDEVISPELRTSLLQIASNDLSDLVRVRMDTYWKSPRHVIRPREELAPVLMLDCQTSEHHHIREYLGNRPLTLGPEHGVLHHLSYAGPDERILRKISTWGHRDEVAQDWYRRVWLGWDRDPSMHNLHPTHPPCYGFAERIELPKELLDVLDLRPNTKDPEPRKDWPTVSVVIPLYGGESDIRHCLESLEMSRDLLKEIVVVDDVSPDAAAMIVEEFSAVKLIRNQRNLGFAATCNAGYESTSGDCVIFLNSDTRVPRAGLIRMVESLLESEDIGAAGPLTNHAGYFQPIRATYTDISRLNLFACDLAAREAEDIDVPMLVGFCVACRRSALQKLNGLPFDPRFGRGLFEDTDLCYRLLRMGYRLRLSNRAYVHHEGSQSLRRADINAGALLEANRQIYLSKWREDLEFGFVDRLPGLDMGAIRFKPDRLPERVKKRISMLADQADISLCMIVKDEERVLGDCLDSTRGAFRQVIVVDTGSSDRTREIALEHDAELYEIEWPDSFAEARNESLRYATGRWILWLDADDTLPLASVEAILEAAIHAPEDVIGYIVPVQFVEEGQGAGTRVDHVKLFRNLSGVYFEGRIHEQILSSLRTVMPGGRIDRIQNAVVLHSGYDTSPEGQAKKAIRDEKLLSLDLKDRPDHPFVLFNLGMTAHYRSGHGEAVQWLQKSIDVAHPGESHIRKAYALMAVSLRESEGPTRALEAIDEGLGKVGPDPELLFHRGLLLSRLNRMEEARDSYLAMPLDASPWFTSLDVGILGAKRSHNLGSVCASLGFHREAKDWYRKALSEAPSSSLSAVEFFALAMETEDFRSAREAHDYLLSAEGPTEKWASLGVSLVQAQGGDPASFLRDAAHRYPGSMGPGLVMARQLLEKGNEVTAEPLLRLLESQGAAEAAFFRGVIFTRRGDFGRALLHMKRALSLDPLHAQTAEQVSALTEVLAKGPPRSDDPKEPSILKGPHCGKLAPPEKRNTIVIVTYNSAQTLRACLSAVLPELGDDGEIVLVDNASIDGTQELLSELMGSDPKAKIIYNQVNIGYAKAANLGILASRGRFVTLLNPDTEPSKGWVEGLASRIEEGYAAVGPLSDRVAAPQYVVRFLEDDDRPPVSELPRRLAQTVRGLTVPTSILMGLCLMLDREILNRYGLLDEETELGADDLELSWRLRLLGCHLAVAADVFVRHEGGASFSTLSIEDRKERISGSDEALLKKLQNYYGAEKVPSSNEIWGIDIFQHVLEAAR